MRAGWLVKLYPRPWRERYGDEMAAMLTDVRLTPSSLLDLVAGAIDARVTPQTIPGRQDAVPSDKEHMMFANLMRRCAVGPDVTPQEKRLGNAVMLGLTVVFAATYLAASYVYRDNDLVHALGILAFPAAMLLSMPLTYLKGHSRLSQVVIVGGMLLLLIGASILAARI